MEWTEIRIKTTQEAVDAVSEMLYSIGSGGVAIEDPNEIRKQIENPGSLDYADRDFLNSLGTEVTVKAYFNEEYSHGELSSLIIEKLKFISQFLDVGKGYVGFSKINEEDWSTAWKKYYKPFHITDGIVIKPSWEEYESCGDETVIELDPGMAFGTGTHETTKLCCRLLEKYLKKGDRVLDVGCGTGILSIVAVKLGADSCTAVDIDEVAARVAKENVAKNDVADRISVYKGVLTDIEKEPYNIVVANIIADVIIQLSGDVPSYLKRGGMFLTSGIIRERKDDVINTYRQLKFDVEDILDMGEWVAIAFKCPGSL